MQKTLFQRPWRLGTRTTLWWAAMAVVMWGAWRQYGGLGLLLAFSVAQALFLNRYLKDEPALDRETLIKIAICVGLLLVFAGTFEPLGFILSSILIGVPMARLYGGRWLPSAVIVSLMSVGLYLLFDKAMDVPLPLGLLDVLEN